MRLPPPLPLLAIALLLGCAETDELRLHLAAVTPDPLQGAAALRIRYDSGEGPQSVEVPVEDGQLGPGAGIRGDAIRDVVLEALDGDGDVVARGERAGDLTPGAGEVRDEPILLLRTGVFSTLDDLALDDERFDACAFAAGDGRVLLAGGGSRGVDQLDLERGTATAVDQLQGRYGACLATALSDGSRALAGDEDGWVERIDADSGAVLGQHQTARSDGALGALDGGSAAWWMGGSADGADLTSELLSTAGGIVEEGPVVHGGARRGHGMTCVEDGATCIVVGADDGTTTWWRLTATSVLHAGAGTAIEPLEHADPLLIGAARAVVPLDDDAVVALLEHADGATLHGLDLTSGDGSWSWRQDTDRDGGGALLPAAGGEVWWIGGEVGGVPSDAVQRVTRGGDGWALDELGASLRVARDGAAAAALDDGRVVVLGGWGPGGFEPSVEVYQP